MWRNQPIGNEIDLADGYCCYSDELRDKDFYFQSLKKFVYIFVHQYCIIFTVERRERGGDRYHVQWGAIYVRTVH